MKVELENLTLGISPITQECYVGVLEKKNPNLWKHKKQVHNEFLHAVVLCWAGKTQVIEGDKYKYEITVKKIKIENKVKTKKSKK